MQATFQESASAKIDRIVGERPSAEHTGRELEVAFDLTILARQRRDTVVNVRAACQTGEKRLVAVKLAEIRLHELNVGETRASKARPFGQGLVSGTFLSTPSQCEISVTKGTILGGAGTAFHTSCIIAGKDLREGACRWGP